MLHRRRIMIARKTRDHEPHRPNQRNEDRPDRARPPLRTRTRRARQEPRRQHETRNREKRRRPRKTGRRAQQNPHENNQQRPNQRRNRPVGHSPRHRRSTHHRDPQVAAQAQRVTRRRVIHPRVRTQRQEGEHRHNRRDRPAREGRLDTGQDAARPPFRDSNTDSRAVSDVSRRGPPGAGYFSDALAHTPMVTESARGRDAARRPRADSCCDVSARESRARSAPSAKECAPRARPRPRAPPPSRQPYPTSRTRSRQRAPWSCPRGP